MFQSRLHCGEHDIAPKAAVKGWPSRAYWNCTPLPCAALLTRIKRSSTAPPGATCCPLGSVTTSVGAYQLENLGIQLFERLDGDYFTVLGLPLTTALDFLRRQVCLAQ